MSRVIIHSLFQLKNSMIDVGNPEENATDFLSMYIDNVLIRVENL